MRSFAKFLLWLLGWKAIEPPAPEDKCIILGVPHTSVMDFIISWLYYTSVGGKANVMVKAEFFVWPLGPLMRALGAVPVDRRRGANVALQMIEQMRKSKKMHLAIAPEGTRKPVTRWKTGFHTIARATGASVYLGYFDWGTKRVGRGERFEITEDANADLERIKEHYRKMNLRGKIKDNFIC